MRNFLVLSTVYLVLSTALAQRAQAACSTTKTTPYCTDYTLTEEMVDGPNGIGRPSCTNPQFGPHHICCDSPDEVNNVYAVRSPICGGSSPEISPSCNVCGKTLFCHGNNYRRGETDSIFPPPAEFVENRSGPLNPGKPQVKYNGITYDMPSEGLYFCDSNLYGCNNDLCKSGTVAGGQGESRLFFPQLKSVSLLSTLLQTIFNPHPSSLKNNVLPSKSDPTNRIHTSNKDTLTTKIDYHQGADDATRVVNTKDNNSSVIVGEPAPSPLYRFGQGNLPYQTSGFCEIPNDQLRYNPGDDLLGPKITARLKYTQKFSYPYAKRPVGCIEDGDPTTEPDKCCSAANGAPAQCILQPPRSQCILWRCATLDDQQLPTLGRTVVFTKTPLVEYLQKVLLTGPQSVYNRLFYRDENRAFAELPSKATYAAGALSYNAQSGPAYLALGSNTKPPPPEVYFPHLGTIFEYFLGAPVIGPSIQTLLRPRGFTSSPLVGSADSDGPILGIECLSKGPADLLSDTTPPDPTKLAALIAKIKQYIADNNPLWVNTKFLQNYQKIIDFGIAHKINPILLLSIYLEETHGEAVGTYPLGCHTETTLDGSLSCFASRPYLRAPLPEFMCRYADGDYPCTFETHPNFVRNVFDYYNQLSSIPPICAS